MKTNFKIYKTKEYVKTYNKQGLECMKTNVTMYKNQISGAYNSMEREEDKQDGIISEVDIVDWLSNKEMIATVMSCTEDAMDALKRYSSKGKYKYTNKLFAASQCCIINHFN